VVVLGSLNEDVVVEVDQAPGPGETVLARGQRGGLGGKGANQAIAAARLGAATAMVGRVGRDDAGERFRAQLRADGVDVTPLVSDETARTGQALIILEEDGENRIIVVPGANARLTTADVAGARAHLDGAGVLLAQCEVPVETLLEAFAVASGIRVLNAAPAGTLPLELLGRVDVLLVNETELFAVQGGAGGPAVARGGSGGEGVADLERRARTTPGHAAVLVTLGARGCLVVPRDSPAVHVPAVALTEGRVVDTTAAGDCFAGALAAALVRGDSMQTAAQWATRAAAVAVTRRGAVDSLPHLTDLADPS
jgi:ribokinase